MQRMAGECAADNGTRGIPIVADLPGLGHAPFRQACLLQHLRYQALAKYVGSDVRCEFDWVPFPGIYSTAHRVSSRSLLRPCTVLCMVPRRGPNSGIAVTVGRLE